jgi:hypothetical protein
MSVTIATPEQRKRLEDVKYLLLECNVRRAAELSANHASAIRYISERSRGTVKYLNFLCDSAIMIEKMGYEKSNPSFEFDCCCLRGDELDELTALGFRFEK